MDYLLTDKEYRELLDKASGPDAIEVVAAMTFVRKLVVGSKCVHEDAKTTYGYCDCCPLSHIGRMGREIRPSYEVSALLCPLSREYSK